MSVELQDQRKVYDGNGTATSFAFPFTLEDGSQVEVVVADADGVETTLIYGTDYTVTFDTPPSGIVQSKGSVVLPTPLPVGYKIALMSNIPEDQQRTFPNNTPYYQEQVEGGIDKNTRLIQQLSESVKRAALAPVTSGKTGAEFFADLKGELEDIRDDAEDAKEDALAYKGSAQEAAILAQDAANDAQDALDQAKLTTVGKIDKVMAQGEFSVTFDEDGDVSNVQGTDHVEYDTATTPTELKIRLPYYYTVGAHELMLFRDYTLDDYPYKVSRFLKLDSVDDGYRHENYKEVGQVGEKTNDVIILGPFQSDSTYTYRYQILGISAASLVDDDTIKWDEDNGISVDAEAVLGDVEDVIREDVEDILNYEYQKVDTKAWSADLDYAQGALVTGSDGSLYAALAVSGPSTTAVDPVGDTTLTWKNLSTVNIIDIADFGAKGDGVTDDTAAIQAAADAAYETSSILYMSQKVNLISDDIEFKSEVMTHASVTIGVAGWETDQLPAVTVYFSRQTDVHDFVFRGVYVRVAPKTGNAQGTMPTSVTRNVFSNSYLALGQDEPITNRYSIQGNTFWCSISRRTSAIKLVNVNNVAISENNFNDHDVCIEISPSRSFAANGIEIRNNNLNVFGTKGIWLRGTSMNRISNVVIENNIISSSNRVNTGNRFNACIAMGYAHQVRIEGNTLNSWSNVISFRACSHLDITGNTIQQAKTYANVQFDASRYVNITKNLFKRFDNGYSILCSSNGVFSGIYTECNWQSHDIIIADNKFECGSAARCIKYENFKNIHFKRNTFTSSSNFSDGCILNSSSSNPDTGSIIDNVFIAPGGTPIKNAPNTMITTLSGQAIQTTSVPARSVNAPVITNTDADVNNAKSYVVTFTLGEASQLKAKNDGDELKTMTEWMSGIAGAILAWNSCANGDGQSDSIVNGVVNDFYGNDKFFRHTTGAIFIDNDGYVTSRDFTGTTLDTQRAAIMLAEDAWQTALFRAPLVVDGAVYDVDTTGIYPKSDFQTRISGRTCLGQKADGTYVLLVVDGRTDSYGCTMEQVANKLLSLGCIQAFNLDGGGSTTLWYNGSVINSPSDPGGERAIPTIMYV